MENGYVTERLEPVFEVEVQGARGSESIEFVVDTGFEDEMSLPSFAIHRLRLPFVSRENAILADGSLVEFDLYEAEIRWHGEWRIVSIHEADTDPLIGMALLNGSDLRITVRRGGAVQVTRLP